MLTTQFLLVCGVVAMAGFGVWELLGKRVLSAENRDRRRRRRNYRRVVSKRRGPTVRLAVNASRA